MRTGNPTLRSRTFTDVAPAASGEAMTVEGVVNRTAFLLLVAVIPASWVWTRVYGAPDPAGAFGALRGWLIAGVLGGLGLAIATVVRKTWAPVTAPLYAAAEGIVLGAISAILETVYRGIVIQAVALTFGVLLGLLLAYRSGLIRATENFKLGVVAATFGIVLIYLVTIGQSFFGIRVPHIHENGWIGIGFSVFVVIVAALNLVLDFDFIEQGADAGAPKYLEWYAAFGLIVTLFWLYLEILRLLAKLRSR
jgi:uncharacterized YccA/Bax inhibitor family protein